MSTAVRLDDGAARSRIRTSLDESLIVEAAAGTGKTTELVRRITAVLASGRARIEGIAAVTFTRKAAGELKLRLRQELDTQTRAADTQASERLQDAIERLEEARIGTIHSFCSDLLRLRPVEAVVDPAFEELSETEAPGLYRKAFRAWIEERLAEGSKGVARALARVAAKEGGDETHPLFNLESSGWNLVEWRDFDARWARPLYDRRSEIDRLVGDIRTLRDAAKAAQRPGDRLAESLRPVVGLAEWIERHEQAGQRDYVMLEGLLVALLREMRKTGNQRKGAGFYAEGLPREQVVGARDLLAQRIGEFQARADADLASLLRDEMAGLIDRYGDLKRRLGKLDFLDLLVRTRDLIRDNAAVRAHLQAQFSHIFVDEFQDTDPLQAEILLLLSASNSAESDWRKITPVSGKLFLVGDPKQSIYRFRRADVSFYKDAVGRLAAGGVGVVHLTRSFRSVRPIQRLVNAAFASEMTADAETGQPDYVPLGEHSEAIGGQPPVVALPVPSPYGWRGGVTRAEVEICLPDTVAAFVHWLLADSGWKVREGGNSELVGIRARHVAILFRRFMNWGKDMSRDYVRALEARGVPHLLVGGRSYHQREEVETLRTALAAIEWPDDELSVYATLRGALFALDDALLYRWRRRCGLLHPFRRRPPDLEAAYQPVSEALDLLAQFHRQRNRQPVVATVHGLLEATRAHAAFVLRPGGGQVLANVHRVADLARTFEISGGISFRGFVEELTAQAEREESIEARVLEQSAEGVRILTVHTAKGLEFPVVILADITANLASRQADRYVDPTIRLCAQRLAGCAPSELVQNSGHEHKWDLAEGVRVAYVAATRARDLLVIPAVGDEPLDGWLGPLNKAIYPSPNRCRESAPADGCPAFGEDSVLNRPPEFSTVPADSVRPGLHRLTAQDSPEEPYDVVWWDPARLNLHAESHFGVDREEILAEDDSGVAAESIRLHKEWREARSRIRSAGSKARFDLVRAAETALPASARAAIRSASVDRPRGGPSGRRFGTLVHLLLRDAPLGGETAAVASLAAMHARILGAPDEERQAAADRVERALRHPLLTQAARAATCHREWPLISQLEDGRLLEGIVDLAYFDGREWTVVDFKTDADLAGARYESQLSWYVWAVGRLTGQPASGWLLSV